MAVHLQIAEQVRKHRQAQKQFLALDSERERAIELTIKQAKEGLPFDTVDINRITEEMNQIATTFQFPHRKMVTEAMVRDYLEKHI